MTPQQKWNAKNPEKLRQATAKWRAENRDKSRATARDWKKRNPEKHCELQQRRKARQKDQTPENADFTLIREFYTEAMQLTATTGIPHQVDHIVALCNGGLHHQDNLQVMTAEANRLKGVS